MSRCACRLVARTLTGGYSLGASGAAYACCAVYALLWPRSTVQVNFIPIPASIAHLAGVCYDLLGALEGRRGLDHWGHLGGAAFGICFHLCGSSGAGWRLAAKRDPVAVSKVSTCYSLRSPAALLVWRNELSGY